MTTNQEHQNDNKKKIIVRPDGPYAVQGNIPLVRKTQIVSEYGEPLTWQKTGTIETPENYLLCRCGHSNEKPFCDGTHCEIDFNGKETADPQASITRRRMYPGSTNILVRVDATLCMESGFCGTRMAHIQQLARATNDPTVRAQVMAMVERCPSGALTYSVDESETDIEPDLPAQVAVTTEITSDGPIAGPLWVTGAIPIERADGKAFETRNRVTLCNCGLSQNKPLCDGTHRHKDAR
ncbi:MAG: CDGSH iron-sulfur domain-containing protein [Anaerolineales bacterium]